MSNGRGLVSMGKLSKETNLNQIYSSLTSQSFGKDVVGLKIMGKKSI